jgi:hypothetical protein
MPLGGLVGEVFQSQPHLPVKEGVDTIMMMAIAVRTATFAQNLGNIGIPSLFVAGKNDRNTPMSISVDAFNVIPSEQKALVILDRGEHAVFSTARCAQMQAAGAIFQAEPRAIGEQLAFEDIVLNPNSGTPIDYCLFDSFVNPVDIRPLVKSVTRFDVTADNVPRMLDTVTAMRLVLELANTFFDAVLVKQAQPGVHFKQYLSPSFMMHKEGEAVSYQEAESFQGRAVECDDLDLASLDPSCLEG